jgi:hypothetical protein
VHVEQSGVRVVNLFSVRRVRWGEIDRFALGPGALGQT